MPNTPAMVEAHFGIPMAGAVLNTLNTRLDPEAIAFMSFLAESGEDAITAAEVAYWRLENMQSHTTGQVYSERFVPIAPVEDAVEGDVMTVRFGPQVAGTGAWWSMVVTRDVWPFAWISES